MQPNDTLTQLTLLARRIMRRFSLDSLLMFALALISEVPVLLIRVVVVAVISVIFNYANGHSSAGPHWLWVGVIPTLWSMFALITPISSGWWWKQRIGGRSPSGRERLAYQDSIELLQSHTHKQLPLPKRWFVLDTNLPDAAVSGRTLMLSHGLLESEHLPAVIAHELGHLATPDGRLTAALNRLVIPKAPGVDVKQIEYQLKKRSQPDENKPRVGSDEMIEAFFLMAAHSWKIAMFGRGGFGLWLTRPIWGHYWRGREYKADHYAATLGQADELADFLENHALIHDHPVPYIWLTEHTHPPVELRIDKLRNTAENHEPTRTQPATPPTGTDPLTA